MVPETLQIRHNQLGVGWAGFFAHRLLEFKPNTFSAPSGRINTAVSLREGHSFLCVPKEKKRRVVCATPLRKGSQSAETTPVTKARNRRDKQRVGLSNRRSLRSNSLPLHPAPDLAARLSGNGPLRPRISSIHKGINWGHPRLTWPPFVDVG